MSLIYSRSGPEILSRRAMMRMAAVAAPIHLIGTATQSMYGIMAVLPHRVLPLFVTQNGVTQCLYRHGTARAESRFTRKELGGLKVINRFLEILAHAITRRTFLIYRRSIRMISTVRARQAALSTLRNTSGRFPTLNKRTAEPKQVRSQLIHFDASSKYHFAHAAKKEWPYFTQTKSESGNVKNPRQLGRVRLPYHSGVG